MKKVFGLASLVSFIVCFLVFALIEAGVSKRYMGAKGCAECHKKEYKIWAESGHAKAYEILPAAKKNDLTCLWCHATDARDNFTNFKIRGVQCEACHGQQPEYAFEVAAGSFLEKHKKNLARPDESLCLDCHSRQRSPGVGSFDYPKRLRLIKHWD